MRRELNRLVRIGAFSALLVCFGARCRAVEKPNLSGAWQLNLQKSDSPSARFSGLSWVIDQKDAGIHVLQTVRYPDGKEAKTEFDCSTDGKDCPVRGEGPPAKVSLWFNGAVLVEMESRGHKNDVVVKKTMQLSEDGKTMSVQLTPIVGHEQAGKLIFEKH